MRTIIHDIENLDLKNYNNEDKIYYAGECNKNCIGCFSCWVKHPKICYIKDNFSSITDNLNDSEEFIFISKCRYGCYSSKVKRVLERCIGYVLPYFTIRNKEIHHKSRYDKQIKLTTYFYGNITTKDRSCIKKLVKANAINLNAKEYEINYIDDLKEIELCIH